MLSRTQTQEVFPSAACPRLAENSRLGFETVASTSRWASGFSISSITLGFRASLYDGRVGSRTTGKERDTESGNDYFGARYYASSMGRFMSPDFNEFEDDPEPVPYAILDNPQSLNLYSYVGNNPLGRTDFNGHIQCQCPPDPDWEATQRELQKQLFIALVAASLVKSQILHPYSLWSKPAAPTATTPASSESTPADPNQNKDGKPKLVSNPKHHPNSSSPEPKNAQELYDKSIKDTSGSGARWAKDADGVIHRFSPESNGETHWNGSTAGPKPIRMENIPPEIRSALK